MKTITLIIKRIPNLAVGVLVWFISFFVPKNKSIWVFGAWEGKSYSDNSRYFMEYVKLNHPDIKCYWVTKDVKTINELSQKQINFLNPYSLRGIRILATASVAVCTHGMHDFAGVLSSKAFLVYLSHGFPLKKIGLDAASSKFIYSRFARSFMRLVPSFRYPDLFICPNETSIPRFSSAFGLPLNKFISIGFSRWRPILEFQKKENMIGEKIKILYAPTQREFGWVDFEFCHGEDLERLALLLKKLNAALYVRPHPALSVAGLNYALKNYGDVIVDYSSNVVADINQNLAEFSILISDYSSLIFDYMVTGGVVISLVPDIEEYVSSSPGIYGNYADSVPGPIFLSWSDLIDFLSKPELCEAVKSAQPGFKKYDMNEIDGKIFLEINRRANEL